MLSGMVPLLLQLLRMKVCEINSFCPCYAANKYVENRVRMKIWRVGKWVDTRNGYTAIRKRIWKPMHCLLWTAPKTLMLNLIKKCSVYDVKCSKNINDTAFSLKRMWLRHDENFYGIIERLIQAFLIDSGLHWYPPTKMENKMRARLVTGWKEQELSEMV